MKPSTDDTQHREPACSRQDEEALRWLMRLASGEARGEELREFEKWRSSDPANQRAFLEAQQLWQQLGPPLQRIQAPPRRGLRRRSVLAACAVGVAVGIGIGQRSSLDWRYDYATGTGERRSYTLGDGSSLRLNTRSAVNVAMDEYQRHVQLLHGEAFFDAVHDPRRPFIVDAGTTQVRVLGTAFGVYRESTDVLVTVQRGRVEVSGAAGAPLVLQEDQQVRVSLLGQLGPPEKVDSQTALAWLRGQLVFDRCPMDEIFAQLRRYETRVLYVEPSDALRREVSAVVDLSQLDDWYDAIQQSLPVDIRRIGPLVWIRARPA